MRLVATAAIALLQTACSLPPPHNSVRADSFDLDARFGERVDVNVDILRTSVIAHNAKNGRAFVALWADAGRDDHLREVEDEFRVWEFDPADPSDVDEIDPPELLSRSFDLYHALTPGQALLAEFGDVPVLYAWDGHEWLFVDAPPGLDHATTTYIMLEPDRIFASNAGQVAVWGGSSWTTVAAPAGSTLGPLSRDAFRTVHAGLCTIAWDWATLQGSTPECAPAGSAPTGVAINGDLDAFFVNDGVVPWRYDHGTWTNTGLSMVPQFSVTTAPGRAVFQIDSEATFPEVRAIDALGVEQPLFPAVEPLITCGCDRAVDATCGCGNPAVAFTDWTLEAAGDAIDVLMVLDHEGERGLYTRHFEAPLSSVPFSDADVP